MSDSVQHKQSSSSKTGSRRWYKISWWRMMSYALVAALLYTSWQMWSIHQFGYSDDGSDADCGIVLGAAAWHNKPSPVFKARIDHAITLYESKRIKAIIFTGGFGKGADYAESEVARNYCMKRGVPARDIYIEKKSQTTEENLLEAKKIMTEKGFRSSLIISDHWHLKRACDIADHYGIQAKPSAARHSLYKSKKSKLKYLWREFQRIHVWKFN